MMQPLIEGEDYYLNENGLMVLTASFLERRGYCCGNGCLHCPYQYEGVPEPKRWELLKNRGGNDTEQSHN